MSGPGTIELGVAYRSLDDDGQYMVDWDVRDDEDGSETDVYVVYFRRDETEDWETMDWWRTRDDAESYMKSRVKGDFHEKCLTAGGLRRALSRLPDDCPVNTVEDSTILGECVHVRHVEGSGHVDVGIAGNDRKGQEMGNGRKGQEMGNDAVEKAVASIETAAGNIKEALKCGRPRDGVTLGEFIQLLSHGTVLTVGLPMMGRTWTTNITVAPETRDGVTRITTNSLNDLSVLERKVDKVFIEDDKLFVRVAREDR